MDFIGALGLILLTLVGYSTGAVIAGRGKKEPLGLLDFGIAVLFLAMALGTRSVLGKWLAIPIWFILAGMGSALLTQMRHKDSRTKNAVNLSPVEKSPLRRVWDWWKIFATEIGNYQGRMLFAFFYFIVVTPFGIGVRLFSDPLKVKQGRGVTGWLERSSVKHDLEAGRDQF
jgi:hypothetical protein